MTVGVGLAAADQILSFFGMDPKDLGLGLMAKIMGGGDKKRRLERVEMVGLAAALNAHQTLKSLEGRNDETAQAVRDGLIVNLVQTIALLVKTADLDGSSSSSLP